MTTSTYDPGGPSPHRVPVDHRVFGLDMRPMLPAAVVLCIGIAWSVILPAINNAVAWDDPIVAGDVIDMGGDVTFVPPVGWQLVDGVRVSQNPTAGVPTDSLALVTSGGAQISAVGGSFAGDSNALMDQVESNVSASTSGFRRTGDRRTVVTTTGLVGVAESYTSASSDGSLATFVIPASMPSNDPGQAKPTAKTSRAITIAAVTAPGKLTASSAAIDAAVRSVSDGSAR